MRFHEIGGLALFGLFILHLIFNYRWIIGVTKKVFSKSLNAKTRIGYIVNFLLLVSFTLVCISGIFISKELFRFNSGMIWKTIHYSSAAAALILTGIHIGLHLKMILSFIKKRIKLSAPVGKAIGLLCSVVLIVFGIYSIGTTSFARWLSMPFMMSSTQQPGGMPDHSGNFQERRQGEDMTPGQRQRQGQRQGQGQRERQMDGSGQHTPSEMAGGFSFSNILRVAAHFVSIASIFAIFTFGLEILVKRLRQRKI